MRRKRTPKHPKPYRPFVEHRNLGEIERRASLLSQAAAGEIGYEEAVERMTGEKIRRERTPGEDDD